jgi:hypothetical protein
MPSASKSVPHFFFTSSLVLTEAGADLGFSHVDHGWDFFTFSMSAAMCMKPSQSFSFTEQYFTILILWSRATARSTGVRINCMYLFVWASSSVSRRLR